MPLISIIVPVYKVEKFLERCVQSLRKQTLFDLEIILVNDGSPDRCPEMCEQYAKEDGRIKVVHKTNGGLSSARNAGLKVAKGTYIGFVDSDDDVELTMYETLYKTAEKYTVDFVMCDYLRVNQNEEQELKSLRIGEGYYDKEKIKNKIYPQLIMGEDLEYGPLLSVWQCLYKREFLNKNKLQFDEMVRWSEDNIFSSIVGYCADSFYYLKSKGLYHYYNNPKSITTSYRNGAWDVYCIMNKHLKSYFDRVKDYDFTYQLKLHMIFYACNCIGQELGRSKKEAVREIKRILDSADLKKAFSKFKFPKDISIALKIQLYLMKWRQTQILYCLKNRNK